MSKKWYPVIDTEKCIECGACIANCEHGVYKTDSAFPIVVNPDNCVEGCEGCGNVCPVGAIDYIGKESVSASACECACDCGVKCN